MYKRILDADWLKVDYYNDGKPMIRVSEFIKGKWIDHFAELPDPVLRCEKCRYYFSLDDGDICRRPGLNAEIVEMPVTPDGYCAWGESREGSI